MNVLKDDLLGCNALIFDPQEHIEVLEGDMNTSKIQLESLILESECSKSTTRESSHKVLVLGIESTKLRDRINIYFSRLGYCTRVM